VPEIRGELIKENGELEIDPSKYRYISYETSKRFTRTILKEGDFVMSVRGTMGKIAVLPKTLEGANMTANLIKISLNPSICDSGFYKQYFLSNSFQEVLNSLSPQTTIQTIQAPNLKSIKLSLPPLHEQQKIAEILSTVDEAIARTDEILDKTQILKKGLMQKLFSKGIDQREYKNLALRKSPKNWEVKALKDIVISYKNGIYKPNEYYGTGYPSVRMYNIRNGHVDTIKAPLLNVTDNELRDFGLLEGDLLINRVNTPELVGRAGIVPADLGKITFESKNIRLRFNKNDVYPEYLSFYVQTPTYLNQIRSRAKKAVAQATITQNDIDTIIFPQPPLPEQRKIAKILSGVDEKIEMEKKRKERLEELKTGLMQVLLTGKVRVKN
jgi:type I restriction enzyme S subunit